MYQASHILYRIAEAFCRRRALFFLAFFAVTSVLCLALLTRSRGYIASASVRVVTADDLVKATIGPEFTNRSWVSVSQQNVNRFKDLLRDDLPGGFLDTALQQAKLNKPIRLDRGADDPRLGALLKGVFTSAPSREVFTIGLVWGDPGECERIVKALRDRYIVDAGQSSQAKALETASFLDSQIKLYEERMRKAEQLLIDYKKNNAGQLPEAQSAEMRRLADLKSELDYQLVTAEDASLRRAALEKRLARIAPTTVLEQTVTGAPGAAKLPAVGSAATPQTPRFVALMASLRDLLAQRSSLRASGYLETSQRVQSLDMEIRTVQEAAQKEFRAQSKPATDGAGGSAQPARVVETRVQENPEYAALSLQLTESLIEDTTQRSRIALLRKKIAEYERRVAGIPLAERALNDKTRDYTALKSRYEKLLTRREDAQIKASLDSVAATSTLNPIGRVYPQPTTGAKKMAVMMGGGALFGLLVGAVLVVLREWMDTTLRYPTDGDRMLGLPVLGSLPDHADLRLLPAAAATPAGAPPAPPTAPPTAA